jgi:RHS repeat-associated protein
MLKTVSETTAGPVPIPPYFYDGNLLLAEKIGNQIQKIYINDGTGIIGMVRPIYDGSNNLTHYQRLYYLYDSLGSVSAITGEHGLPLQNYTYSPYGTCLNVTGDPINNLQFVGRYGGYLDNDTGLTYFWHRWYDSKDGRWISRDPINVYGGINLYSYVKNRVLNFTDFMGLWEDCNGCAAQQRSCSNKVQKNATIGARAVFGFAVGCHIACEPLRPSWVLWGACLTACSVKEEQMEQDVEREMEKGFEHCNEQYQNCICGLK